MRHARSLFGLGLALAAVLALGLSFAGRFSADATSYAAWNPWALAGLVLVAGLADGVNPCAFSTLLVYIGTVLGVVERSVSRLAASEDPDSGAPSPDLSRAEPLVSTRRSLLRFALAYAFGMAATYFAVGLGFLSIQQLAPIGWLPLMLRLFGAALGVWGLLIVFEWFFPGVQLAPGVPRALHPLLRRSARSTTAAGGAVAGSLVGLCTIPCSGAIYLVVLALLSQGPRPFALGYLALYNLAYIAPLLLIALIASDRSVLLALSRRFVRWRSAIKLGLGLAVLGLGVFVAAR